MRKTHTGTDIITFWVSNMQMWPSGSSQLTKGVSALHHRLLLIIAKKLPLHRDKLGTLGRNESLISKFYKEHQCTSTMAATETILSLSI